MTLYFKLPILLIFSTTLILQCKADECSKIYVLPMFAEETNCLVKDVADYNCTFMVKQFLQYCSFGIGQHRQIISVFNFNYTSIYNCMIGSVFNFCSLAYNIKNNVTISRNENFAIWEMLNRQVQKDVKSKCFNNSLALFMTDVPCQDFDKYPALNDLFVRNMDTTKDMLYNMGLHAFLVLIGKNISETSDESCPQIHNLNMTTKSYLAHAHLNYYNLFEQSYGYSLCSASGFPEEPGRRFVPKTKDATLGVSIACGVVGLLILLWLAFWATRIYKRWRESKIEAFSSQHTKNFKHLLFGNYLDEWEVTPKELKVDQKQVLGRGAFATVYKGHLKKKRNDELIEMDVAVKFPHDHASEAMREDMIKEIGFMKALGSHENLLVMVGYVKSVDNPVICTVYCACGDLLEILRKHDLHYMSSERCQEVEICLLLKDLLRISLEVCSGLVYLASLRYIHRDIAARNVLLTYSLQAKLSDFGLCRQLEDDQEFLIEKDGKFPIKYMPYESLKHGQFSEASDVWTFGVLMYEMFSSGKRPFEEIPPEDFVNHLENDGKPEFPSETPNEILQILNNQCFQKEPELRSTFAELIYELKEFHLDVINMEEE